MDLEVTGLERFELFDSIARGATGQVFEGRDRTDSSRCAVKVIDPKLSAGARFETILNAEAPGAVAFRHANAARTLFAGKSGSHTIIATELMHGQPLDAWIQRAAAHSRPLPWELMTFIGFQVVNVLRSAHQTPWAEGESKGMYHCSISPHSIFLLPDGGVRLLGVGLGRSRMCLPPSRHKLPYRAPELFERQKPDELTDIYSLGVTLYDAISRSRFYGRETVADIKQAILDENPPSLRIERPEIDPEIDELIIEMMSKFPRTRPPFRKVEEILRSLSRRATCSASSLAKWYAELFGTNGRAKRAAKPKQAEDSSGFYPEYDIDDLVEKLFSTKKAPTPPRLEFREPESRLDEIDAGRDNPFDVDALVNAIVTGAKPPPKAPTPPPRTPPARVSTPPPRPREKTDEQLYEGALSALEDGDSFDVDAIVNAIVSSSPPAPKPLSEEETTDPKPLSEDEVTQPNMHVRLVEDQNPSARGISVKNAPSRTPRQIIENTEPRGEVTRPEVSRTADALSATESLKPGDVIGDRYRVIGALGEGGMSVVYRVEHTLLLKQMALKLLRSELSSLPSVVERFQLEARSVCQLDDPNIVRVTDFGRQPNGSLYLVMDYLTGESLAARLRREGKLPPMQALDIAAQILSGLSHAHRFGVVHRDLKPENIMLVPKFDRTQVKILDFGIAKLAAREEEDSAKPITQAGTVFGTPRYMSPEQASAEPVDLRADLYAVGVILYECLSGEPPFDGPSAVKILAKVLTEDPPPLNLTEPNRKVGMAIEAAVMCALQKEKEDRFPTADAFHAALLRAMVDSGPAR